MQKNLSTSYKGPFTTLDPKDHTSYPIPEPRSGTTTGVTGLFWAAVDIKPLKKRTERAFQTGSSEGKFHSVADISSIPLRVTISVLGIITGLARILQSTKSIFKIIGAVAAISAMAIVFVAVSVAFLVVEAIRTTVGIVKSINFGKNQNFQKTLATLNALSITDGHSIQRVGTYIQRNYVELQSLLGETEFMIWSNNPEERLEQYKAIITQKKIENIYNTYISNPKEKKRDYLSRRLGSTTVQTFEAAAKHMEHYTPDHISTMTKDELEVFNDKGFKLLSLLERRRKKVLKVHVFSIAVLTASLLSIAVSSPILPGIAPAIVTSCSILAGSTAVARGFAQNAYIEHTGEGVNIRLAIPKELCPKEGERNFSIWNGSKAPKKVAYIFFAFVTAGLLVLFDWTYKSQWIKKARGIGDKFYAPSAAFPIDEITIEDPY